MVLCFGVLEGSHSWYGETLTVDRSGKWCCADWVVELQEGTSDDSDSSVGGDTTVELPLLGWESVQVRLSKINF